MSLPTQRNSQDPALCSSSWNIGSFSFVLDPDESGSNWNYTKVWFYIGRSGCFPFKGPQYNAEERREMILNFEQLQIPPESNIFNEPAKLVPNWTWTTWKGNQEVEACKFIHCNLIPYKPSCYYANLRWMEYDGGKAGVVRVNLWWGIGKTLSHNAPDCLFISSTNTQTSSW